MVLLQKQRYPSYSHIECYGRVVSLYVFVKRKWVKVGDYCKRCGEIGLLEKYEKGFAEEKRRFSSY